MLRHECPHHNPDEILVYQRRQEAQRLIIWFDEGFIVCGLREAIRALNQLVSGLKFPKHERLLEPDA